MCETRSFDKCQWKVAPTATTHSNGGSFHYVCSSLKRFLIVVCCLYALKGKQSEPKGRWYTHTEHTYMAVWDIPLTLWHVTNQKKQNSRIIVLPLLLLREVEHIGIYTNIYLQKSFLIRNEKSFVYPVSRYLTIKEFSDQKDGCNTFSTHRCTSFLNFYCATSIGMRLGRYFKCRLTDDPH